MLVRIERYYKYPDLKRQTPGEAMQWDGITFTEDAVDACDFLVILEYPGRDINVWVPPANVIHLCQEPPNEVSLYRQYANKKAGFVINQFDTKKSNSLSHGALPWHVDKTYDQLKNMPADVQHKSDEIAWITGYQQSSEGHRKRSAFVDRIREFPYVKLYGRGIRPVKDKWDALYPVKYGIAYENTQSDYYWTEKISDCFLSFTMPLYFGCETISDVFPEGSFIRLNPDDPHIDLFFKDLIKKDLFTTNFEALLEARSMVLDKLQLFPFLARLIRELELQKDDGPAKEKLFIPGGLAYFDNYPLAIAVKKWKQRLSQKIKALKK